jgi:catechol 2,3-dioxygenase-like lactoylglutathione lyase family enzyme
MPLDETAPQPALTGIHHVSLLALDLERTVEFYVDVLGLRIVDPAAEDAPSPPDRVWLGDERNRLIAITQSPDGRPGRPGIGTIDHVGLAVTSVDALLKWKRWLRHNQILVHGPYDQQAYQDIVFTDPDGVLLEIATLGPGWEATRNGEDVYSPPKMSMAPFRNEELISIRTWPHPVTEIEPDMALRGLHHIATVTSSLERTDTFYREILALPLVRKMIDSDDPEVERWYWGLDGRPGTLVAAFPIVHPHEGGTAAHGRVGPGVALHYALDLGSDDALQSRVSTLSVAGTEVTFVVDEAGNPAVSLHDPDGQVIELVTADPRRPAGAQAGASHRSKVGRMPDPVSATSGSGNPEGKPQELRQ